MRHNTECTFLKMRENNACFIINNKVKERNIYNLSFYRHSVSRSIYL